MHLFVQQLFFRWPTFFSVVVWTFGSLKVGDLNSLNRISSSQVNGKAVMLPRVDLRSVELPAAGQISMQEMSTPVTRGYSIAPMPERY